MAMDDSVRSAAVEAAALVFARLTDSAALYALSALVRAADEHDLFKHEALEAARRAGWQNVARRVRRHVRRDDSENGANGEGEGGGEFYTVGDLMIVDDMIRDGVFEERNSN